MTSEVVSAINNRSRIRTIDAMRGLVMLIMLVDHVRERFFLHKQVSDPMNLETTSTDLFWTRLLAHLCAPTFIFLTGLSAWLYANPPSGPRSARGFLARRGLFLIFLEFTLVTFSWMGNYHTVYLQVIWAIGLSMLALAALCHLPRLWLALIGLVIVFGHNLLTPVQFSPGDVLYPLWTILHDRGYLLQSDVLSVKISYPVLPWIGVILLGYACGPVYSRTATALWRQKWLLTLGIGSLLGFALFRGFNLYGETLDWHRQSSVLLTIMDVFNLTKYPPSLNFLLVTLGLMFICLWGMEKARGFTGSKAENILVSFGAAPMFFYLLHLYTLLVIYSVAVAVMGTNQGPYLSVSHVYWVWVIAAVLAVILYWPTKKFGEYKRRSALAWVKYL